MKQLSLNIPGYGRVNPVGDIPTGGTDTVQNVIQFGTTFLLIAATLLSLAFLIWGGIAWTMSGGDKTAVEGARKIITYAIIGLVIAFLSFFIINTVGNFFGVNLLNPISTNRCSDTNRTGSCPAGKTCTYSRDVGHYRCRDICDRSREICPD